MKTLILVVSLAATLPTATAFAADGTSTAQKPGASYPDPYDGLIGMPIRSHKPTPNIQDIGTTRAPSVSETVRPDINDPNIPGTAPQPKDQTPDRPLGLG